MARKASRFVDPLTPKDREMLEYLRDRGETARIRRRAHAILLSASGKSVDEIVEIFATTRVTVCAWFQRWEKDGPAGLGDESRPGGPTILTEEERERVLELLKEYPTRPKKVLELIKKTIGKCISSRTLRRIARSGKLRWKRMRRSLKDRRDEDEFREAQQHLEGFIEDHKAGEYNLYYFDEAAFSLVPTVPYGWQEIGERIEIPSQRSGLISVLGFLGYDGNLTPYLTEGTVNSEVVVACMDDFSKKINGCPTLVVIDNASPHTSAKVKATVEIWEERGLFFYFLPPYCPALNLIELLWRMIKHHWLPLKAYSSFKALLEGIKQVLAGIGTEYRLNFS